MSTPSIRKSSRLQEKRSAVPGQQVSGASTKNNEKKEIDDVSLLLIIKPLAETLLEYIKAIEDSDQNQPEEDNHIIVERRKYTELRDIFLKMMQQDMSKYLQLYRQKVVTDGEVEVTKKFVSIVTGILIQAMMIMSRDIE